MMVACTWGDTSLNVGVQIRWVVFNSYPLLISLKSVAYWKQFSLGTEVAYSGGGVIDNGSSLVRKMKASSHTLLVFWVSFFVSAGSGVVENAWPQVSPPQTGQRFQRQLDWLDSRIELAQKLTRGAVDAKTTTALNQAISYRNRAVSMSAAGRPVLADSYIKTANSLVEQVIRAALEGPVQQQREKLDREIRRAEDLVVGSGNEEAVRLLERAKKMRDRAVAAYQENRYATAVEYYRIGLYLVDQAVNLAGKRTKPARERVAEEQERYRRLKEQAQRIVAQSTVEQAKLLFQEALRQEEQARRAGSQGNDELAVKMYHQSYRLMLRAMDLASENGRALEVRSNRSLERVRSQIDRVRSDASSLGALSQKLYDQAVTYYDRARASHQSGQYGQAIRQCEIAQNLLTRLVSHDGQGGVGFSREKIDSELERIRRALEALTGESVQNPEIQGLVRMAVEQFRRAEQSYRVQDDRLTLERLLVVARLIHAIQAMDADTEIVEQEQAMERVESNLNRLQGLLREIGPRVEGAGLWVQGLYDQAREMAQMGRTALENGQLILAETSVRLGIEQATKILQEIQ